MKRTVKAKNIISFTAVLILLISVTVVPAYASFLPQRIKAGIAAGLTALNITMNSTVAPVQEMIDYIGDPFNVNYTWAEAWNDRPQIQIWDDYIEIDGEQYTDIWISNEAAEKFRVNAFDFISANNIVSHDSGDFAEGVGYVNGLPIYNVGTGSMPYLSQKVEVYSPGTYPMGDATITVDNPTSRQSGRIKYNNNNVAGMYDYPNRFPWWGQLQGNSNQGLQYKIGNTVSTSGTGPFFQLTGQPFDFEFVSQTIPANEPLPDDTGMMIRIPSYDPNGNKYLEPFFVDNPEFQQDQPVTVDVNLDPDIMGKLDDLFDLIVPIIPIINNNFGDIQFVENHPDTPVPVPDIPIVDATVHDVTQPIIQEIQNQGDIISQSIPPIIESIPKIDEICNNIDTAPYHDLDTGLDRLPTVFLPFITDLRSALGIWHYVTEWLAQISTTFAFVSGCLVGTSIMTPIYAAIAGFMCIKIYRRMTA